MRDHAEMEKKAEKSEATSTIPVKKLSEKQKIIQEQGNLLKEKEKEISTDGPSAKDKEILSAKKKLKKKERSHDGMSKRLDMAEALSTCTVNELSEKEKMIQDQAQLIEEKEKEGSSDTFRDHSEMAKRLEKSEATSTRAAKKLSEKHKIIQEQGNLIKEKEK